MPTDPSLDPSNIVWDNPVDPNLDPSNIVWDTPSPTRAAPDVQGEPQQRVFDPQFPKALEVADIPFGVVKPFRNLHEVGRMALGGGLDIVRGVATLPFDIGEVFGSEGARKISDNISRAIPDVPAHSVPERIGQVLTQYGIPQVAAFKLMQGIMLGSSAAINFAARMFAGGLSDFLVAAPDEEPLLFRGETKTHLGKRAKIGAEGAVIGGGIELAAKPVGFAIKKAKELAGFITNPRKAAEHAVGASLRREALDPDQAIVNIRQNLDELTQGRYQPTTASVADDLGLIGTEQAISREKGFQKYFTDRGEINMRAISDTLEDVTNQMGGNGQRAKAYFEEVINNTVAGKENVIKAADDAMTAATKETENFVDSIAQQQGKKGNASALLDNVIRNELDGLTRVKNKLYANIDPTNSVPIDMNRFFRQVKTLVKPKGKFDVSVKELPDKLKNVLRKSLTKDPKTKKLKPIFFGETTDLKVSVNDAITEALAARRGIGRGAVVDRLDDFKRYLDDLPEEIMAAGGSAGERAKLANQFFKEVMVPRFRRHIGEKYVQATRKGKPIPQEDVAKKFLKSPAGARDAAQQLKLIISKSQNKAQAGKAIEQWIVSDVADKLYTTAGKIKPKAFDNYLKDMREQLKNYPDVKKRLETYRASLGKRVTKQTEIGERIQAARNDLKKTQKDIKRTAAQYFVNNDPTGAIGAALNAPDPVKAFSDLATLAKKDTSGEALRGLRTALADFIENSVRGQKEVGGVSAVVRDRYFKLFDNKVTKEAISKLYSPTEMKKLDEVRKYLRAEEVRDKKISTTLVGKEAARITQQARVLLASIYGIVKGRGIFQISSWIMKALGRNPEQVANQVLTEAMLDPELAAMLLERQSAKALPRIKERFMAWLINNLYDEKLADETE